MSDHVIHFCDYCRIVLTFPTVSDRDEWKQNHTHEGEEE